VVIAIITVGSLPFSKIATAQDYVLAEAAKPMLGETGFTIITVAALISTFSAINASLYGGSRVNYEIAEDDEISHEFTNILWNQPVGLLVTAVLTLLIANTLNLESISTAGSVGFLIIFAMVNYVGFKLSRELNGNKIIPLIGFILCLTATVVLLIQQYSANKTGALIAMGIVLFSFSIEYFYKTKEKKTKS
jgi:amino acid transporter